MENAKTFKVATAQLAQYIVNYYSNIRSRKVYPAVGPGFLRTLIPDRAPETPDNWGNVFNDIEGVIMPGICHWQHPNFAAYFPSKTSYAAILAEMLSNALANDVISWESSPSGTELEVIVLDWLAKMLQLPEMFLSTSEGYGGGVIHSSSTESTLLTLYTARTISLNKVKEGNAEMEDGLAITKLIAYHSAETHSSFIKACHLTLVKFRNIKMDDKRAIRGSNLKEAIEEDKAKGLVPFYICATLGSTSLLAFDNIEEIGVVCRDEGIWLHIDAAYAGNSFICPEYRYLLNGVELADSFSFNTHKWLQVPLACSVLWLKHSNKLVEACSSPGICLQHSETSGMPSYTDWQIQYGRPFRALKLWFVLRLFGINRLQELIRKDIELAQTFKIFIEKDSRFELIGENFMSLVCFRLKGSNEMNERLLTLINATREVHIVSSKMDDILFLRFVVTSNLSKFNDINHSYKIIAKQAGEVLHSAGKSHRMSFDYCCCISSKFRE